MPVKRRYRKTTKKAPLRRRRYRRKTRLTRSVGAPGQVFCKLRYSSVYAANIAIGGLSTRIWSLNSLYDPDFSGVGGQPLFFDQYTAMYSQYRVYGVKVSAVFSFGSSTNNCFHPTVCMVPSMSSSSTGDIQVAIQMRGSKWMNVVPAQGKAYFKKYYSIASIYGVPKKAVQAEDNYAALTGSSPADQVYLQLYAFNNDASATFAMTSEIRLTYYCKFYNLRQVSAS